MWQSPQLLQLLHHLHLQVFKLVCSSNFLIKVRGKVAHLYSAAVSMWLSYLQNALHYFPGRANPPNLGVKITGSHQLTHAGWGLTCLPTNAMALLVLIYTCVG